MTSQPRLLLAMSLCLAALGLAGGAFAADKGPGACCVNVQDMSRVDYAGAGKVNVGDGFVANNRDDAAGGPGGRSRNLGSLSGIGSTNELGRAGFTGGPGNPPSPGFAGGVTVAVGDVDSQSPPSGRITGVAVDPSGTAAGGTATGGNAEGGRHFNGVVNRVAQGKADDTGEGATAHVGGANAPGQDSYYGTGVYKSTDGGQTWQQGHDTGALRSLSNGNAAAGNAAAGGANGGVWKTTNILTATPPATTPPAATDSRAGVGVLKSMDGGNTWAGRTTGPAFKK
ncbi:MAG: hypothetical protein IT562_23365 [Alphaproteobacteria bacterium]|nr:hypothetical protein [Alphaproteobacteria bacterium]